MLSLLSKTLPSARLKNIATCNVSATEQRAGFMWARQIAREDANQKGSGSWTDETMGQALK